MRLARIAVLGALLAGTSLSAQAAELRLDDAALDQVSAGFGFIGFPGIPGAPGIPSAPSVPSWPGLPSAPGLPSSPLMDQLPAIMDANGYGEVLSVVNIGGMLGQVGSIGGMPFGGF